MVLEQLSQCFLCLLLIGWLVALPVVLACILRSRGTSLAWQGRDIGLVMVCLPVSWLAVVCTFPVMWYINWRMRRERAALIAVEVARGPDR